MVMRLSVKTALVAALPALLSCGSNASSAGGDAGAATPCGPTSAARAANEVVFKGLQPVCQGCHTTGARAYFASIDDFEALVAYAPAIVTPGNPDGSLLVQLLEADAPGNYKQMPVAGPTYAQLVQSGTATLPIDAVRSWIASLQPEAVSTAPSAAAPRVTRIGPAEAQRALYQQLGLSDDDFFTMASEYQIPALNPRIDDDYPVRSFDAIPPPYDVVSPARFGTLGGGSAMMQLGVDPTTPPAFVGSLAQTSQRWCSIALAKKNNAALLPTFASLSAGSATPDPVKALIKAWFLHFHATVATDAQVDEVFADVFVPVEKGADTLTAYAATCSYFVRHPDWIFY